MGRDYKAELKRRKIELWSLIPLGVVLIILNWLLFRSYSLDDSFPLSHALFFFGILNLNILVFLGIIFFLGRNLVKIYAEAKPRRIGKTLKTRLFLAFVSFAFIPTCLMFLVSVFYINNSFDRWFANQTQDTLKHSNALTNHYISDIKFGAFFVANRLVESFEDEKITQEYLDEKVKNYGVDAIEYYNVSSKIYTSSIFSEKSGFYLPQLKWKDLESDLKNGNLKSRMRKTEQGEWLSAAVVTKDKSGFLIVSKVLPFTLVDTIESVIAARTDFQKTKEFKIPLKSTYLFILVTMTLVILAFGGWFSLYLAESLSKSLAALGVATKKISKGEFSPIYFKTGMEEINELVDNFNTMTKELKVSRADLKEHSIYINTVLSQVSSGVVSCDNGLNVSFANKRIESIFKLNLKKIKGKNFKSIFPKEIYKLIEDFERSEEEISINEVDVKINGDSSTPLQVTVASLQGLEKEKIGTVVTIEKVDLLRENQRVKAWKEVATRVAHEIKNPLTPVMLSAERLQKRFSENVNDPVFDQCIKTILSHVNLIKDLVNEFNQFARFPKLKPETVEFQGFIEDLMESYKSAHPDVQFSFISKGSSELCFDKDQMQRVFINLIDNSIEAMRLTSDKKVFIELSKSDSGKVSWVRFYDSGPGIPRENWKKAFKSQYTTKTSVGGLGLSIVKKIIDDHSGRISILKGEKSPSVFLIELPVRSV